MVRTRWHTQLRLSVTFFSVLTILDAICDPSLNRSTATRNLFVTSRQREWLFQRAKLLHHTTQLNLIRIGLGYCEWPIRLPSIDWAFLRICDKINLFFLFSRCPQVAQVGARDIATSMKLYLTLLFLSRYQIVKKSQMMEGNGIGYLQSAMLLRS